MLQSLIDSCMNITMRLQAAFIDFKMLFDHVSKDCRRYKLLMSGIIGLIFKYFLNIYIIATQLLNSSIMPEYLAIVNII